MIGRGKRRTRLGFSIIEVLMALSLLVMFFAASGEVFKSTVLLSSASQDLCDHTSQIDSVERQLRVDAWNCR
jgi:prepilin-type N-terminal cleavage/methylation domain-containing protein